GEGADGDEVDSGFGVVADGLEVHVAGGFNGGVGQAFADEFEGCGDFFGGHVVEQDGVGAAGDGLIEFDGSADFNLDGLAGLAAAEGDVVVLDQDSVLQVVAVVVAAAAADGVLVEDAQAGDGFAGVEDAGL